MGIELDVHGLSVTQAIYQIQRTIVNNPSCFCIEVIHGFNNGCILKNILKNKHNIHNSKVLKTLPVPLNEGRTYIILKR